jgi:hypothetical protein
MNDKVKYFWATEIGFIKNDSILKGIKINLISTRFSAIYLRVIYNN